MLKQHYHTLKMFSDRATTKSDYSYRPPLHARWFFNCYCLRSFYRHGGGMILHGRPPPTKRAVHDHLRLETGHGHHRRRVNTTTRWRQRARALPKRTIMAPPADAEVCPLSDAEQPSCAQPVTRYRVRTRTGRVTRRLRENTVSLPDNPCRARLPLSFIYFFSYALYTYTHTHTRATS